MSTIGTGPQQLSRESGRAAALLTDFDVALISGPSEDRVDPRRVAETIVDACEGTEVALHRIDGGVALTSPALAPERVEITRHDLHGDDEQIQIAVGPVLIDGFTSYDSGTRAEDLWTAVFALENGICLRVIDGRADPFVRAARHNMWWAPDRAWTGWARREWFDSLPGTEANPAQVDAYMRTHVRDLKLPVSHEPET